MPVCVIRLNVIVLCSFAGYCTPTPLSRTVDSLIIVVTLAVIGQRIYAVQQPRQPRSSTDIDRLFKKFFHWHSVWKIYINAIIKDPTKPQVIRITVWSPFLLTVYMYVEHINNFILSITFMTFFCHSMCSIVFFMLTSAINWLLFVCS